MGLRDQGRYAEALETYEQALAIQREVGDRAGEGTTLNNIGFVYQHRGGYAEALETYEQAMAVFESLRSVAGSEAGRAGFIAQYANLYDRAVELYHRQGQDAEAFFTSERGRGRAFLDSLATGYVELPDDAAADLLAREQEAYAARQAAQDALAKARSLDPPDPALVADLEAQLAAAEQEHQAALDAITARGGQLAALVPGRSGVLDLAAVQALLDDQTTLVSYWVLGDEGTPGLRHHPRQLHHGRAARRHPGQPGQGRDRPAPWTTGKTLTPSPCATCMPGWWRPWPNTCRHPRS